MIEWLHTLHSSEGISELIQTGGLILIILIVFAETGLLFGFFLPGDSLLITAGVLANPNNPHHVPTLEILNLNFLLIFAVILGDQVGYFLGNKFGHSVSGWENGRIYKKKHLEAARVFYARYGKSAVVLAKYVPIFRTFVPFVAGIAKMPYRRFCFWSILGGVLWITSLLWIGYYLGSTPLANRLDKIILIVIFVSILPMLIGTLKRLQSAKAI